MDNIYYFKTLSDVEGCRHLVTTKDSRYPFNFSLALHTGEDVDSILSNRETLRGEFPKGTKFIVANQTHSDTVKVISSSSEQGWSSQEGAIESCDALVTDQKRVALTILTADCVPILLFDPKRGVVSAIHAGWRGTEKQIAIKAVEKMVSEFNSNPKDIIAGIAPSIGRCCYEVDWEVAKNFTHYTNPFDEVGDKYMLDLPLINREQLMSAGLLEESIELSGVCTSCSVDSFFSYRRESGCSGRFMSIICNV